MAEKGLVSSFEGNRRVDSNIPYIIIYGTWKFMQKFQVNNAIYLNYGTDFAIYKDKVITN